jgi:glucuronoarabinoxylan endo-1,4-beta-xylanase
MKNRTFHIVLLLCLSLLALPFQTQAIEYATMRVDNQLRYQRITGYGGFVNSPQFGYNHMSESEIKQVWGKSSTVGCNIMRMYLPIGQGSWSQSLATAKLAKSMGLTLFASPWSMPAEWKTNNNIAGYVDDGNGGRIIGYLKEEHYEDYANYLNDFVTYLRNNGVELDAISIQNEPDWQTSYAGCIWTPTQMATFIRDYAHLIHCPVIAPETVGFPDSYANALWNEDVMQNFEIYGGHQYGAMQSEFKKFQTRGKELWMTEFLINWNADTNTERNFNWSIDGFSFAKSMNDALLANVNAWIHYASKRYYGMMGDGMFGTQNGVITKRGAIMAQYARYTIGSTRIDHQFKDDANVLQGSAFESVTGDTVVVMVINPSNEIYSLTVDLPFYTKSGRRIQTNSSVNASFRGLTFEESCRPEVQVSASSVVTFVFIKERERPVSYMSGSPAYANPIESQIRTNAAFGTSYQLSGKTAIFDNSRRLISSFSDASNGYLRLDDRYTQLVFQINSIQSPMSYTSANTTLYYVNDQGQARSHNYGIIEFPSNGPSEWVLDISKNTLADGCTGIIGLSNGNWTSVLTFDFAAVYFRLGNEKQFAFSGVYSEGDSNLMDCLENPAYTSLNFTQATDIPTTSNWADLAANPNCLYYVSSDLSMSAPNVVAGTNAQNIRLQADQGDFYAPNAVLAQSATFECAVSDYRLVSIPFESNKPEGLTVYSVQVVGNEVVCNELLTDLMPANQPLLLKGNGNFVFSGAGTVVTPKKLQVSSMNVVYVETPAPTGSYVFALDQGNPIMKRVDASSPVRVAPFTVYLKEGSGFTDASILLNVIPSSIDRIESDPIITNSVYYDLNGRRMDKNARGIRIGSGQKELLLP